MSSPLDIGKNLETVRQKIAEAALASGRNVNDITLVAVSKKKPATDVLAAIAAGQVVFGENYVKEAVEKIDAIKSGSADKQNTRVQFHLIGSLQSNKAKLSVGMFDLIQTVDRFSLAQAISKSACAKNIVQKVLIQVNISSEQSKSGVLVAEAAELVSALRDLPGVDVQGLMSIGTYFPEDASEEIRTSEFLQMSALKANLENNLNISLPELSMGMSHDYSLAIKAGATIVRVGSAIFGER